ncbi:MAG: DUF302 domain-containing protein [Acidimicrobiia bacterium]|nr:MAG: DUF302 domain-containing protein [Acidimicrobiia bacterium]
MDTTRYGLKTLSPLPMAAAEKMVREALAAEGFGILTEIDVAETLRVKLGVERGPYLILGACNPQLAAQALETEADVGLLLPCNVVLYESEEGTVVAALDPSTMVELTGNQGLESVAKQARASLERVIEALGATA